MFKLHCSHPVFVSFLILDLEQCLQVLSFPKSFDTSVYCTNVFVVIDNAVGGLNCLPCGPIDSALNINELCGVHCSKHVNVSLVLPF